MADSVSDKILINATPAEVMAVIQDIESYPQWGDFTEVQVLSKNADGLAEDARFSLKTAIGSDTYEIHYTWNGNESVSWTLNEQSSMLKVLNGTYALADKGGSTEVTYELEVDIKLPLMGFMKKKAGQTIVDTALKGLKKRVES